MPVNDPVHSTPPARKAFFQALFAVLVAAVLVANGSSLRADDERPAAITDAAAARDMIERAPAAAEQAAAPRANASQPTAAAVAEPAPNVELAKLSALVAARQLEARRLAQRAPADALTLLEELAATVAAADIPNGTKGQFKRRIDRTRLDIEQATGKRSSELALDRKNAAIE